MPPVVRGFFSIALAIFTINAPTALAQTLPPTDMQATRSAFAADVQVASDKELESLIRRDFERCHPGDTLDDLKRRAAFSKEDRGLLRDWMSHRKRCGAGLSAPASR